jgi:hypothetical protein
MSRDSADIAPIGVNADRRLVDQAVLDPVYVADPGRDVGYIPSGEMMHGPGLQDARRVGRVACLSVKGAEFQVLAVVARLDGYRDRCQRDAQKLWCQDWRQLAERTHEIPRLSRRHP